MMAVDKWNGRWRVSVKVIEKKKGRTDMWGKEC